MKISIQFLLLVILSIAPSTKLFAQNESKPVVVLVHGYKPEDEMDVVEKAYKKHGYEVVRFRYDWEVGLEKSADQLVDEITAAQKKYQVKELKVVAHSMGGLVSRRSMIQGRDKTLANKEFKIDFVTVASPFGGFTSANFASMLPFNIFGAKESHRSLGTTSSFITDPGSLGSNITHTKIETIENDKKRTITREVKVKERNSTRTYQIPETVKDSVVLPHQQANEKIDKDQQLAKIIRLDMGHVGVIVDSSGELSSELSEALGLKPIQASSPSPCENNINSTLPINPDSDLLKVAPHLNQ